MSNMLGGASSVWLQVVGINLYIPLSYGCFLGMLSQAALIWLVGLEGRSRVRYCRGTVGHCMYFANAT
jgi:hypothetical protein